MLLCFRLSIDSRGERVEVFGLAVAEVRLGGGRNKVWFSGCTLTQVESVVLSRIMIREELLLEVVLQMCEVVLHCG